MAYGCDVVALQECESGTGAAEILGSHELVGAVAAEESRGWVQLYVRRGLQHERIELASGMPCVAMRVVVEAGGAEAENLVIAAVHMPVGDCAGKRLRIVEEYEGPPEPSFQAPVMPRGGFEAP